MAGKGPCRPDRFAGRFEQGAGIAVVVEVFVPALWRTGIRGIGYGIGVIKPFPLELRNIETPDFIAGVIEVASAEQAKAMRLGIVPARRVGHDAQR